MRLSGLLFIVAAVLFVLAAFEVDVEHLVEWGLAVTAAGLAVVSFGDRNVG